MSSHPLNLALRFFLEMAALVAIGYWGWQVDSGFVRILLAFGLPALAALLWGIFAVPDDPSRSGRAPVPVSGILRLVLELFFFGIATWMLSNTCEGKLALVLGISVIIHYGFSTDRIKWLISTH